MQSESKLILYVREDCKDQVHGYSHNKFKKFDTLDQAWDFVDQYSSNAGQLFKTNSKAIEITIKLH